MNALEIAKSLIEFYQQHIKANHCWEDTIVEAATMLRQQQAEIDEWKYISQRLESVIKNKESEIEALKAKTLTDEEITEVLNDENIAEYHQGNWLVLPYAFARAILRKAQEK